MPSRPEVHRKIARRFAQEGIEIGVLHVPGDSDLSRSSDFLFWQREIDMQPFHAATSPSGS